MTWHSGLCQFSGHTHATRVEDLESSLRQAVTSYREAGSSDLREKKIKAVENLAKRLLAARLRLLNARVESAAPIGSVNDTGRIAGVENLRQREAETRNGGVREILIEFGAPDALDS